MDINIPLPVELELGIKNLTLLDNFSIEEPYIYIKSSPFRIFGRFYYCKKRYFNGETGEYIFTRNIALSDEYKGSGREEEEEEEESIPSGTVMMEDDNFYVSFTLLKQGGWGLFSKNKIKSPSQEEKSVSSFYYDIKKEDLLYKKDKDSFITTSHTAYILFKDVKQNDDNYPIGIKLDRLRLNKSKLILCINYLPIDNSDFTNTQIRFRTSRTKSGEITSSSSSSTNFKLGLYITKDIINDYELLFDIDQSHKTKKTKGKEKIEKRIQWIEGSNRNTLMIDENRLSRLKNNIHKIIPIEEPVIEIEKEVIEIPSSPNLIEEEEEEEEEEVNIKEEREVIEIPPSPNIIEEKKEILNVEEKEEEEEKKSEDIENILDNVVNINPFLFGYKPVQEWIDMFIESFTKNPYVWKKEYILDSLESHIIPNNEISIFINKLLPIHKKFKTILDDWSYNKSDIEKKIYTLNQFFSNIYLFQLFLLYTHPDRWVIIYDAVLTRIIIRSISSILSNIGIIKSILARNVNRIEELESIYDPYHIFHTEIALKYISGGNEEEGHIINLLSYYDMEKVVNDTINGKSFVFNNISKTYYQNMKEKQLSNLLFIRELIIWSHVIYDIYRYTDPESSIISSKKSTKSFKDFYDNFIKNLIIIFSEEEETDIKILNLIDKEFSDLIDKCIIYPDILGIIQIHLELRKLAVEEQKNAIKINGNLKKITSIAKKFSLDIRKLYDNEKLGDDYEKIIIHGEKGYLYTNWIKINLNDQSPQSKLKSFDINICRHVDMTLWKKGLKESTDENEIFPFFMKNNEEFYYSEMANTIASFYIQYSLTFYKVIRLGHTKRSEYQQVTTTERKKKKKKTKHHERLEGEEEKGNDEYTEQPLKRRRLKTVIKELSDKYIIEIIEGIGKIQINPGKKNMIEYDIMEGSIIELPLHIAYCFKE